METIEQVNALANLPADVVIMKLENETIQSLAMAHPRDHKAIRESLVKQIEAYPSFARTAIYTKPVGKETETQQMKYARGLSIRAAEALAEAYKYNRVRSDVSIIDDTHVKVEATFSDYQNGRIWQTGTIVSKFYRSRQGQMTRIPDDRFYNVTVKSEISKCVREVILRSIPPGLRSELTELVESEIEKLLDDSTIQKIIANFGNKNVPIDILEKRLGKSVKSGWTIEDRKNLIGLWNSLEQDETTVQEILDGELKDNSDNKNAKIEGPVSAEDFKPAQPEERLPEVQQKIDEQKANLQASVEPSIQESKKRKVRSDKGKKRNQDETEQIKEPEKQNNGRADYHCNNPACQKDFEKPARTSTRFDAETDIQRSIYQCPFCYRWETTKNE